ncbi:MAG: hypothetical protein CSA03_00395 [Bacteroidetes bacterium]|nr:MAG: hypothetical protein CSA03_00395 [Bacteroidota bacterium]
MGSTKKYFYTQKQLELSDMCKALGHPARISIVKILSENRQLNCDGIYSQLKLSKSTISRHCKVLHETGIIGYEVIGNNCIYHLNNNVLDRINEFIDNINICPMPLTNQVYYPASPS